MVHMMVSLAKRLIIQFDKAKGPAVTKIDAQTEADIKFGYCTEFIILLNQPMSEET